MLSFACSRHVLALQKRVRDRFEVQRPGKRYKPQTLHEALPPKAYDGATEPVIDKDGELAVPVAKIKAVQFSLVRAEELEQVGVEVIKATVNSQHTASDGGLSSGYQGAQSRKDECKTCFDDNIHCQAHQPFLRLPIPCYKNECIRALLSLIKCVCPYCSRCPIRKGTRHYDELMAISDLKTRLEEAVRVCSRMAVCPITSVNTSPSDVQSVIQAVTTNNGCGARIPNFKREGLSILVQINDNEPYIRVHELAIFDILYDIHEEDAVLLLGNTMTRPHDTMWTTLPLPPMASRPSHEAYDGTGNWGLNDFTGKYRTVVRLAIELGNALLGDKKGQITTPISSSSGKKEKQKSIPFNTGGGINVLSELNMRIPGGVPIGEWRKSICTRTRELGIGLNGWTTDERQYHSRHLQKNTMETPNALEPALRHPLSKKIRTAAMIYCELVSHLASLLSTENVAKSADTATAAITAAGRQQALSESMQQPGVAGTQPKPMVNNGMMGARSMTIAKQRGGKTKSYREKLSGKGGSMRRHCAGKRVDFSARTVVTPNPFLKSTQVGVPVPIAMKLTDPGRVRYYNMHEMTASLRNGPHIHPGINYIRHKNGKKVDLTSRNYSTFTLQWEDLVQRHAVNGDDIINNRYPSLHKQSMMGHEVWINGNMSEDLPGPCTTPYNADFDGDEMNLNKPQSFECKAEVKEIMGVHKQMRSQRNSGALIYPVQDTPNSAYLTTAPGQVFTYEKGMQYLMQCPGWNGKMPWPTICVKDPTTKKMQAYISGCDLISAILPPNTYVLREVNLSKPKLTLLQLPVSALQDIHSFLAPHDQGTVQQLSRHFRNRLSTFTFAMTDNEREDIRYDRPEYRERKDLRDYAVQVGEQMTANSQNGLRIQNSYLCYGRLTREKLRDIVADLAVDPVLSSYSHDHDVINFIHDLEMLCHHILMDKGQTFGYDELINPDPEQTDAIIEALCAWMDKVEREKIPVTEDQINAVISKARQLIEDIIIGHAHEQSIIKGKRDGFFEIVSAGGKGNPANIVQIRATLLQQYSMGKRFVQGIKGYHGVSDALFRGIIKEGLGNPRGLSAWSHMYHSACSREGLADTAVKIRDTGYCERKLTKGTGVYMITSRYTVASGDGKCCQNAFGDDNVDPSRLEKATLHMINQDNATFKRAHYISERDWSALQRDGELLGKNDRKSFASFWKVICANRRSLRKFQLESFDHTLQSTVYVPVCFDRLLHRFAVAKDKGPWFQKKAHQIKEYIQSAQGLNVSYIVRSIQKKLKELSSHYPLRPFTYFWALMLEWLSPKRILCEYQWSRQTFDDVLDYIEKQYVYAMLAPGEMQGMNSAQCISELITQLTFNTFHFAGASSQLVGGIPRLKEIINMQSQLLTPAMTIVLNDEYNTEADATRAAMALPSVYLSNVLTQMPDVFPINTVFSDPKERQTTAKLRMQYISTEHGGLSDHMIRWKLDKKKCIASGMTPRHIVTKIQHYLAEQVKLINRSQTKTKSKINKNASSNCRFSDRHYWMMSCVTDDQWMIGLRLNEESMIDYLPLWNKYITTNSTYKTKRHFLGIIAGACGLATRLKGVRGITSAVVAQQSEDTIHTATGQTKKITRWIINTCGTNLERILQLLEVDVSRTRSNDIREIEEVLGIRAAIEATQANFQSLLAKNGWIHPRHTIFVAKAMGFEGTMLPMNRYGIVRSKTSTLATSMFEMPVDTLISASLFGKTDPLNGIDENTLIGNIGKMGTYFTDVRPAPVIDDPHADVLHPVSFSQRWIAPYKHVDSVPKPQLLLAVRNIASVWRKKFPKLVLHPYLQLYRYKPSTKLNGNVSFGQSVTMRSTSDYFAQICQLEPRIVKSIPCISSALSLPQVVYPFPSLNIPTMPTRMIDSLAMPPPPPRPPVLQPSPDMHLIITATDSSHPVSEPAVVAAPLTRTFIIHQPDWRIETHTDRMHAWPEPPQLPFKILIPDVCFELA